MNKVNNKSTKALINKRKKGNIGQKYALIANPKIKKRNGIQKSS